MPQAPADRIAAFRQLHEAGCFILPNPWDAGSAKLLQGLGFKALASTSAGCAWSMGRPDGGIGVDDALAHLLVLTDATELPVNADFQNGFSDHPEGVAENVARAVETGISGLSIEDSTQNPSEPLYDFDLAVLRIRAARAAIDATGSGVVLTARSEGFIVGRPDLDETIRRLKAFAEAGADCLYAPGLPDLDMIGAVVAAAPLPVNVLVGGPSIPVPDLAAAGVRRISTGAALARVAYAAALVSVQQLKDAGAFQPFPPITPFKSLNAALS
jgi:methylisocitrate lyase